MAPGPWTSVEPNGDAGKGVLLDEVLFGESKDGGTAKVERRGEGVAIPAKAK
jgi:hypothetical protein